MAKRIAVVGAGALGGYVGGTLAHLGHDVTLIDAWPENVETIRSRGLELDGMTPEERFTVHEGGDNHTILRVGEPHGRITSRIEELAAWFKGIDSSKTTTNLWGERWSKLCQNGMGNGVTAATGLSTPACANNSAIRRF